MLKILRPKSVGATLICVRPEVRVGTIGGGHPVFAGIAFTGQELPSLVRVYLGPRFGTKHLVDDEHGGVKMIVD
jgi:hypothetical protein